MRATLPQAMEQLWTATEPMREEDFALPAVEAAESLLGTVLIHGKTAGMIVETEAYVGGDDLASHSARGRTPRTDVLWGRPGRAYVYFIYGMHECLNVVVDHEGSPGCVLVRALQPLCGVDLMRERRATRHGKECGLTNGPGKLTEALAITRVHYGRNLTEGDLVLRRWRVRPAFEVHRTPRIGITHCADWPLRFVWAGHPCLSRRLPIAARP